MLIQQHGILIYYNWNNFVLNYNLIQLQYLWPVLTQSSL